MNRTLTAARPRLPLSLLSHHIAPLRLHLPEEKNTTARILKSTTNITRRDYSISTSTAFQRPSTQSPNLAMDRQQGGHRGRGRGHARRRGAVRPNHHMANGAASEHRAQKPLHVLDDVKPPLSEPVPEDTQRFSDLSQTGTVHPTLIQTITQDLKFDHMMPVQAATLHILLPPSRKDCLVQAKTGTGKTMAFLLPAIQTLINTDRRSIGGISLLVISPTRELAMQIAKEATNLLQRLPQYRVRIAIGGTNKDREERDILKGCEILIATPGRLLDHMNNERIRDAFHTLNTLVLDEADRLLDMGFSKDIGQIVKCLPDKVQSKRQGMLFSATIAPHVHQVANLVLSPGYQFISTIPEGEANTHERVPQTLVEAPSFALTVPAMVSCIRAEAAQEQNFKAIVFAPTAALVDFYGDILSPLGRLPPVSVLHSRMSQNKRTKVTNDFRTSKAAILVATDVVARGMDFPGVTTVFQVGVPTDKQSYIHRLGRTARANSDGRGVFIVSQAESWFPTWQLKDINFVKQEPDLSCVAEVNAIAEKMDLADKAKIYQAWLGYYKNHIKAFKWSVEDLVAEGNAFARDGMRSLEPLPIAKTTAGKMGLRGVKGLLIVANPPKQGGGGRGRN